MSAYGKEVYWKDGNGNHSFGELYDADYVPCSGGFDEDYYICEECGQPFDKDGNELTYHAGNGMHELSDEVYEADYTSCGGGFKEETYECVYCGNLLDKDGEYAEYFEGDDNHKAGEFVMEANYTACNGGYKEDLYFCEQCEMLVNKDGKDIDWFDGNGKHSMFELDLADYYIEGEGEFWGCDVCGMIYKDKAGSIDVYEAASRIYGDNRYATSFAIAETLKEWTGVDKFDTLIIADGKNYPDALAGSYLAAKKNAPILMVNSKSSKNIANLQAYIKESAASGATIYILGGTAAVSDKVKSGMSGYNFVRLAGDDRYATNLAILKEAGVTNEDILVCTGKEFADSLSASAAGKPILLVGKSLRADQKEFLASVNSDLRIIGGTAAVNEKIENDLKSFGNTDRIFGENRYETSVALAEEFFPEAYLSVVAYAHNFPDGLCGGPLAYAMEAPMILTGANMAKKPSLKKEQASAELAREYVAEHEIAWGCVLGGESVISYNTIKHVFSMDETGVVSVIKYE